MSDDRTDHKFMELAVDEMLLSRTEHGERPDPKVGAVLIDKDGKILGQTHRGALRDGHHAEYTLIERLLGDKVLDGATIYVTLEPCIKRNPPKKPCVEWIVKARIGKVFIGMTDPNPDISGRGINYLLKHGVQVQLFPIDLFERITSANKDFIEYCEMAGRVADIPGDFEGPSAKEREIVKSARLEDLSGPAIRAYLDRRGAAFAVPSDELWNFMWKNGFLDKKEGEDFDLTAAGVLLFGNAPEDLLPQSKILVEEHIGSGVTTEEITGPLLSYRDKIDAFLRKGMRTFTEIRRYERVAVEEYPIEALREAFFNAAIHRDYREGWRIQVRKLRDRIEILSPGLPLQPITISRMNNFDAPPFSRNPRIAVTLGHMKWVEERARGLTKMRELCIERGLRPPVFSTDGAYLKVTFWGQEGAWQNVRIQSAYFDELDPIKQGIISYLQEKKRMSTKQCVDRFKIDPTTARRHLRQLRDLGIVEPKGRGARHYYILAGS